MLTHPEIPTCKDCQQWLYSPKTWIQAQRGGKPQPRPAGTPTPCWQCPKSEDKATPNPEAELTDRNWRAWELYQEIKAGRPMPHDAIVWRNCGLIRQIEDEAARSQGNYIAAMIEVLVGVKRG